MTESNYNYSVINGVLVTRSNRDNTTHAHGDYDDLARLVEAAQKAMAMQEQRRDDKVAERGAGPRIDG